MKTAQSSKSRTAGVKATMTDRDVVEFCKNGYVILKGVVSDDVNKRACTFADEHPQLFPNELMSQDWFVDGVLLNPQAAGVVRSLLGENFELPKLMVNHRVVCPNPTSLGWHVDGGSRWGPELFDLQVFYLPQNTPIEMGPTDLLPGSHLAPNTMRIMAHYGAVRNIISTAAPAGSIFVTAYRLWHRAGNATGTGVRNLFKYCYSRTANPTRDWVTQPDFDLSRVDFTGPASMLGEQFHECFTAAQMFTWLCGKGEHYRNVGGQGWPVPAPRIEAPYGFPAALKTV